MKKILVACLLAMTIFGIYPKYVEAIETYDVIYGEVSRYHRGAKEIAWIAMAILYAADTYQVDPLLITSIMESESSFNFKAISVAGAVGLMQLMPETAREIGVNPYVPLQNVIGGTINLKNQLNRFAVYGDNALINAIAAYNAGPQAVINAGGVPNYRETRQYVVRVTNNYQRLLSMAGR